MKIGITLTGGFVKGVAHIGFLKALEYKGLSPSFVSGTSAGAIIGALYCAGYSPEELIDIAKTLTWKDIASVSMKGGLFKLSGLRERLLSLLGDITFAELKVPFGLTVVDLKTLKTVYVTDGKLLDFIVASCSIPPLFSPWKINGRFYMDGGIRNCMPAEMAKVTGCDIVICSNVNVPPETINPESILETALGVSLAGVLENQERRIPYCDLLINHKLKGSRFDFSQVELFYEEGFKASLKALEEFEGLI